MVFDLTPLDFAALLWFLAAWAGYNLIGDRLAPGRDSINRQLLGLREAWMARMLQRDNRISDTALLGHTIHSASFFASTTMLVLAGLVGLLGAIDRGFSVISDLTLAIKTTRLLVEFKVILLIAIFVYAFFRFTWALRQYNYLCVLFGAAPLATQGDRHDGVAKQLATMLTLCIASFNGGLRSFYFAVAAMTWFIHPLLFMGATLWTIGVLVRRQYFSRTHRTITEAGFLLRPPN